MHTVDGEGDGEEEADGPREELVAAAAVPVGRGAPVRVQQLDQTQKEADAVKYRDADSVSADEKYKHVWAQFHIGNVAPDKVITKLRNSGFQRPFSDNCIQFFAARGFTLPVD